VPPYLFLAYADTILGRIGPRGIDAATRIVGFFCLRDGHGADLPRRGRGDPELCAGRTALTGWSDSAVTRINSRADESVGLKVEGKTGNIARARPMGLSRGGDFLGLAGTAEAAVGDRECLTIR
jgi:hypothetical protein